MWKLVHVYWSNRSQRHGIPHHNIIVDRLITRCKSIDKCCHVEHLWDFVSETVVIDDTCSMCVSLSTTTECHRISSATRLIGCVIGWTRRWLQLGSAGVSLLLARTRGCAQQQQSRLSSTDSTDKPARQNGLRGSHSATRFARHAQNIVALVLLVLLPMLLHLLYLYDAPFPT